MDRSRWDELRSALAAAFKSRTRDEWADAFYGTDACVTPVLTYDEALAHPHLVDRHTCTAIDGVDQPAPRLGSRVPPRRCPPGRARSGLADQLRDWTSDADLPRLRAPCRTTPLYGRAGL